MAKDAVRIGRVDIKVVRGDAGSILALHTYILAVHLEEQRCVRIAYCGSLVPNNKKLCLSEEKKNIVSEGVSSFSRSKRRRGLFITLSMFLKK
jgi:hypothetical protein